MAELAGGERSKKEVKVTFDSSLWKNPEAGPAGRPQRVGWSYLDGETVRYIPVVYRFSGGVVFDILTPVEDTALQEFFARYEDLDEEALDDTGRRCLGQAHPYRFPALRSWRINGSEPIGVNSSGALLLSEQLKKRWKQAEDPAESALAAALRREQGALVGQSSFGCCRVRLEFASAHSCRERLRRALRCYKVHSLEFETRPRRRLYPTALELTDEQGLNEGAVLQNPVNGQVHRVYLSHICREAVELPGSGTFYYASALYELDPPLPKGQRLLFDSVLPPQPKESAVQTLEAQVPVFTREKEALPESVGACSTQIPPEAAAIGVIGGEDGPTAVFVTAGKREGAAAEMPVGAHGLPTGACMSVPAGDPRQSRIFRITGVECTEQEAEKIVLGGYKNKNHGC